MNPRINWLAFTPLLDNTGVEKFVVPIEEVVVEPIPEELAVWVGRFGVDEIDMLGLPDDGLLADFEAETLFDSWIGGLLLWTGFRMVCTSPNVEALDAEGCGGGCTVGWTDEVLTGEISWSVDEDIDGVVDDEGVGDERADDDEGVGDERVDDIEGDGDERVDVDEGEGVGDERVDADEGVDGERVDAKDG